MRGLAREGKRDSASSWQLRVCFATAAQEAPREGPRVLTKALEEALTDLPSLNPACPSCTPHRMLCKDPRRRATIPELLEHPWLSAKNARFSESSEKPKSVPDAVVSRLQQFAAMNKFKKQARKVLATFLPEEEVRRSGTGAEQGSKLLHGDQAHTHSLFY